MQSILLTASTTGRPTRASRASATSSPLAQRGAATTRMAASAPPSAASPFAVHEMREPAAGSGGGARRVRQDHPETRTGDQALDAVPRRLRLRRDDAELAPRECVQERRLADVRAAGQYDRAPAVGVLRVHPGDFSAGSARIRCAASCSARRRLLPSASAARSRPGTSQRTRKLWSWGSPDTSSTR